MAAISSFVRMILADPKFSRSRSGFLEPGMGTMKGFLLINKKPFIVPIPGSRKPDRLRENFGSANIILTKDEIAAIDAALDTMSFDVFGGHSGK